VLFTRRTGPLLSAEVKWRITAGGGVLFMRQFAFSAHGGQHPMFFSKWPNPPPPRVRDWVTLARVGRGLLWCFGASMGESFFKKGLPQAW
jgi:hypothetical protein